MDRCFPKFESALMKAFPENSHKDGKWVYYSNTNSIKKIDNPVVSKVLTTYNFYQVEMTNFLDYHVYKSTCLILFDSLKLKAILAVPMWYNDISQDFLKLFIHKKFADTTTLMNFVRELQYLMCVGSRITTGSPKFTGDRVIFDMANNYFKGGKEVWRHIEILVIDNTIKSFKSTNPTTKESITVQ